VARLSTIIPHLHDDLRLEETILSVLENRPNGCEIVVVHDGSYTDPYQLSDEVIFIQDDQLGLVGLINAGLMACAAPTVCLLSPGLHVGDDAWADGACRKLASQPDLASVAIPITQAGEALPLCGISSKAISDSGALQRGQFEQRGGSAVAAPLLACGFYNRRALLALGGWNATLHWENADIELAMLMRRLGLECQVDETASVHARHRLHREQSNASVKQLASLAVAYGLCSSGASVAMTDLLRGCLGGNISAAVAWATGIIGPRISQSIEQRIRIAAGRLRDFRSAADSQSQRSLSRAA
jgi:hypothetical protein